MKRIFNKSMCDTFVADTTATGNGSVILGKNSDRQPNEPQEIIITPARVTSEEEVKCTYISIPQVDNIYATVLSKPNWMFGAEMGINEHGVSIGNEAVWTIFDKNNREERLLGMDMLRLALERSKSAEKAMNNIIDLLSTYGQGGNCGFAVDEFYDNSFIIADREEAWILETAGNYWIAEKVKGIRSISNTLTITDNYDRIHPDLLQYALDHKLCKSEDEFNFKAQFSDKYNITRIGAMGDRRAACTYNNMSQNKGEITVEHAFSTLRDHNREGDFHPKKASMRSPCLHASSLVTPSQSTSSMVSHMSKEHTIGWFTGTSTPCLSVFKPIRPGSMVRLETLPRSYEPGHLWWEHEKLQRMVIDNYVELSSRFVPKFREYENDLIQNLRKSPEQIDKHTEKAFQWHYDAILASIDEIESTSYDTSVFDLRYRRYWKKLSKQAKIIS